MLREKAARETKDYQNRKSNKVRTGYQKDRDGVEAGFESTSSWSTRGRAALLSYLACFSRLRPLVEDRRAERAKTLFFSTYLMIVLLHS